MISCLILKYIISILPEYIVELEGFPVVSNNLSIQMWNG